MKLVGGNPPQQPGLEGVEEMPSLDQDFETVQRALMERYGYSAPGDEPWYALFRIEGEFLRLRKQADPNIYDTNMLLRYENERLQHVLEQLADSPYSAEDRKVARQALEEVNDA
jgi:hypothetical protein